MKICRIRFLFFALFFLLGICFCTSVEASSKDWTYNKATKTLTVYRTVRGDADGYPWDSYKNQAEVLSIKKGVKSISERSFQNFFKLKKVTMADGVTIIGESAFENCTKLSSVKFSGKLKDIGACAFYGCAKLKKLRFPDSLTAIGYYSFWGCSGLEQVRMSRKLVSIEESAFEGCTKLKRITLYRKLKTIEMNVFDYCPNLKIRCYKNSEAWRYAKKNKLAYTLCR